MKNLKVIITGTTGMVGEGVLHECLNSPEVESVLIINRKPLGITHNKLKEVIHSDFYNLNPIQDKLQGYDACFFCLGVTSVGKNEVEYTKVTYTLTLHIAETLVKVNNNMTFCYVSGDGTDSSEKGKSMWARVKGKTENDLAKLPFKDFYAFRPGFIKPTKGLKNTHTFYYYISWLYPVGKALYSNGFNTLQEVGLAMINLATHGDNKPIIKGKDITRLAKGL